MTVLAAFVASRLWVGFIIFISSVTIPMRAGPFLYAFPENLALDGLVRDDSWWYVNIITHGYSMGDVATGAQGNAAFFPLYPLLVRMIAGLTGNVFVAGILVSNVAFFVALLYLYALARREWDDETAARAVLYLSAAPTAVFFSAMYTESLYILLVTATFFYARERQWDRAALAGALAAATRNTGVLLAAVIALEGLHQGGVRWRPAGWTRQELLAHGRRQLRIALRHWPVLGAAGAVTFGLIAYMAYLANTFGDPLGFIHVQATWGRDVSAAGFSRLASNVRRQLNIGVAPLAGQINVPVLLNLLFTLGFAPLVAATVFRLRPAYGVFAGLTFLVPLSTGTVGSMTRYVLMLIPCFLLLAHWGRRSWVDRLILIVFLPFLCYFTIVFSHWYFAG